MLVIFTSDLIGKLVCVWNYFRQFRNYLKKSQTQIKGIKRILQRNSKYLKGINFRENLFSGMNFLVISRELIFAKERISKISREQIFANEDIFKYFAKIYFRERSKFLYLKIFFFLIKKDIKRIRIRKKYLEKLI